MEYPKHILTLASAALLFATAATAEVRLTPHSAEYKVKISVLSGTLNTRLETTESGYAATHKIVPTGMAKLLAGGNIEESSDFEAADAGGLMPTHYLSSDTITKDKTQADISFDWSTGEISGTVNSEQVEDVLPELAYDRVSIQYELMHDLMNGGASGTYVLFDIDELKTLNVKSIGTREIKVPAGTYTALGIQHQAEGSSRITTLWCVEELDYLPVMIEQHRKGKLRMRASLKSYTPETT